VVAGGRRRPCVAWPRRPMHMGPAPGPLSHSFFSFLFIFLLPPPGNPTGPAHFPSPARPSVLPPS
jgi:hypothetical protein